MDQGLLSERERSKHYQVKLKFLGKGGGGGSDTFSSFQNTHEEFRTPPPTIRWIDLFTITIDQQFGSTKDIRIFNLMN